MDRRILSLGETEVSEYQHHEFLAIDRPLA